MTISSTGRGMIIALGTLLIAAGTVVAALGNINLTAARDRERAVAASEKAMSMPKTESSNNLAHRQALEGQQIPIEGFETTAWNIISGEDLLCELLRGLLH
jgi:hypothetical protein